MQKIAVTILLLIIYALTAQAHEVLPEDTLVLDQKSNFLVFPFFLRSPETDWGFGVASAYFFKAKKNDKEIRTSDVNLVSLYTLKNQLLVVLGSNVYFPKEKEIFRWLSSYSYYPDKFWGIGNSSPASAQEGYKIKQFYFNPQFLLKVYKKVYLGASAEYQQVKDVNYLKGGVFDIENVAGRNGGATSGLGFLITLDSRNNAYSPSKGGFVEFNTTLFNRNFYSDFNFVTYTLELKKFFEVRTNTILAFHGYSKVNDGDVPIRNLAMLGGSEMMRGFYKGRYTDKNLFASQVELRQYLFWRIGFVAFASTGQVTNRIHDWRWDRLHFSYGAGFRILVQKKEKLNLRIDYGRGEKGDGVYVILKEAF